MGKRFGQINPQLERRILELAGRTPAPPPFDPDVSESEFQDQVRAFALRCEWEKVYHTHDSRRSEPGFLDTVFGREHKAPHVVVAELKVKDRAPTPDQERWLLFWRLAGVPVYVWRPENWDEIARVLGT